MKAQDSGEAEGVLYSVIGEGGNGMARMSCVDYGDVG
jgi:hypothetical protein